MSFEKQVKSLERIVGMKISLNNHKEITAALKNKFRCPNKGLVDSVKFVLNSIHLCVVNKQTFFDELNTLNLLLYCEFG